MTGYALYNLKLLADCTGYGPRCSDNRMTWRSMCGLVRRGFAEEYVPPSSKDGRAPIYIRITDLGRAEAAKEKAA